MAGNEVAPKGPQAGDVMASFMPKDHKLKEGPEIKFEAKPFTKEELDEKVGAGSVEVKNKGPFMSIIADAKKALAAESGDGTVRHGSTMEFSIDDKNYVYLRDDSQKSAANKDRLFERK